MKNLLFILLCLAVISCTKEDDIYSCIDRTAENNNCITQVYEYDYNGTKVHSFVAGNKICRDASSFLVDENCNSLCPSGDLSGQNGCPAYQNLTNQKLIWER